MAQSAAIQPGGWKAKSWPEDLYFVTLSGTSALEKRKGRFEPRHKGEKQKLGRAACSFSELKEVLRILEGTSTKKIPWGSGGVRKKKRINRFLRKGGTKSKYYVKGQVYASRFFSA